MSGRMRDDIGEVGPSYGGTVKEEGDTSESGDAGSSHSMGMSIYHPSYESPPDIIPAQEAMMSGLPGTSSAPEHSSYPSLKVKRPGRPRIHPPKPVGISKPRGRPRGSKNKKPRKRKDPATASERPPKRPRGRPRKWPPEMWEGFQRSQYAATQHMHEMHRQQQHQQHSQEMMPGPSHLYYDDHVLPQHEDVSSAVPPPLSHLPYMVSPHEAPEMPHMMHMHPPEPMPDHRHPPPQHHHLHHPVRHHHEQPHLAQQNVRPLYMQEHERRLREHALMVSQEEQSFYHHDGLHRPPHTTS